MAKNKEKEHLPTQEEVEKYTMLSELLDSLITETKDLSKKKPDEVLNKLKIKMINRVLEQLKQILRNESTSEFLDLLEEEAIPSNSDAVFIMGQFRASMDQFKSKYYGRTFSGERSRWFTQENPGTHYNY